MGHTPERVDPAPAQTPSKPVVRIELKPYQPPIAPAAPPESAPHTNEPASSSGGFWTQVSGGRTLRLPVVAAYALLLATAGLLLATWAFAYRMGVKKGKDDMAAFVRSVAPSVVEPTRSATTLLPQPDLVRAESTPRVTTSTTPPPPIRHEREPTQPASTSIMSVESLLASASTAGASATMTSRGFVATDPRVSGLNYLELATLSRDDCARAVLFLSANGLEAIGVPLDQAGTRANNASPRFRVVAWPGLSADQLREGTSKQAMEREVARLGRIWSTEHKGPSDFRMPQWTKFR